MKYAWIEETEGNGKVTGLNRGAQEGEMEANCSNQVLTWGMDTELYVVEGYILRPLTQEEADVIFAARQATKDYEAAVVNIDKEFMEALELPVIVNIKDTEYHFKGGYESSQYIDSARQLADNLNENDCELWDFYDEPHIFSKAEANDIAVAVGLSFRSNYSAMKHAKKALKDQ